MSTCDESGEGHATAATTTNDAALMLRIAAGDHQALLALYDRYSNVLMALAQTMVGGGLDAEAVIHEVWIDVWQRPGCYRPNLGTVRAWLVLQIRRHALQIRHTQPEIVCQIPSGRFVSRPSRPRSPKLPLLWPNHGHNFEDERLAAKRALARLPKTQREILELAYFDCQSLTEIAQALSLPITAVRAHMAHVFHEVGQALQAVRR